MNYLTLRRRLARLACSKLFRAIFSGAILVLLPVWLTVWFIACTPDRSLLEPKSMPNKLIGSALISTPSPILRDGKDLIKIVSIDGEETEYLDNRVFVSPGVHTFRVVVELRKDSTSSTDEVLVTRADTSLTFKAEANGEYLVDARENRNGVWVWATNLKNKYIVAGDPPPTERK